MSRKDEVTIKVGFGDKMEELKVVLADRDIKPYQPEDKLSVVGAPLDRVDARAKVTGRAKYTYDRKLPGMLYGQTLRSPHANCNIVKVDLTKAKAMPGVKAAIDLTEIFSTKTIRFAWDGIAAVAAETEAQAEEALRAIEVEYEVLPFCVTKEAAMKDDAPKVGRGNQQNVQPMFRSRSLRQKRDESTEDWKERIQDHVDEGAAKFDEAAKGADHVLEQTFHTQVQTHSSLETHGVLCDWNGDDLICYASTQAVFGVKNEMTSQRNHVNAASAHVHSEYVGGGFGSKFSAGREGYTGAILAREAGHPVKLMLNRREEHTSVGNRPDSTQHIKMGVKKNGDIVCYQVRSYGTPGSGAFGSGAANDTMYEFGVVDKVEYAVRTNCGAVRAMRAPGWPQGVFASEAMMDMAAAAIGMDPIEFRIKNDRHLIRPTEMKIGAEKIGWNKKRKRRRSKKDRVQSGVGCAGSQWFARGGPRAGCIVRIHKNGAIEARNGSQDIGTGTRTIMGMVVAEELGVGLGDVTTFIGDSNDPVGPASGGSTTAPTLTPAARLAGYTAGKELLEIVADKKKLKVEDLELAGGEVLRKGRSLDEKLSFKQACALMDDDLIEVNEKHPGMIRGEGGDRRGRGGFSGTNAGAQFAEVEVDTETGNVKVKKVVAVSDAGKIMNAKTATSQVRGAVIQGVSYALFENRVMDRLEGRMMNADLENYKIAGPKECPEIETIFMDVYNGWNNTNVMGLGEPPIIATAAAIANAVSDAIGVRMSSIPITPKKVLEALAAKERKK